MKKKYFNTVALMAITALLAVNLPSCKDKRQPELPTPKPPVSLGTIGTKPTTPSTPTTPPTPPANGDHFNATTGEGKVGTVAFKMVKIEAVTDATLGHADIGSNQPHTVTLSTYYIGEAEVTQELWQAVMGANPSFFNNTGDQKDPNGYTYDTTPAVGETQEKRPVETINWFSCIAFCNELTKKVNGNSVAACVYYSDAAKTTVYTTADATAEKEPYPDWTKKGFRLPTEAEWEYAALGGTTNKYAGTDDQAQLGNFAWFRTNAGNKTHEVKKRQANGYNLYDMSGNVFEWCWDWDGAIAGNANLGKDPAGSVSGTKRIERGGQFIATHLFCRRAFRPSCTPADCYFTLGLRLSCDS